MRVPSLGLGSIFRFHLGASSFIDTEREASRLKFNPEMPVIPEGCTNVLSSALAAISCICALTEASMIFGVEDEDFLSGVKDARGLEWTLILPDPDICSCPSAPAWPKGF